MNIYFLNFNFIEDLGRRGDLQRTPLDQTAHSTSIPEPKQT